MSCECKLCGLRGHSKNVTCRSVFPDFRGRPLLLASYEHQIKARKDEENDGQYLFGSNARDWTQDDAPFIGFAETLINYLKTPGAQIEDLRILLCVHEWVQDPGTATV